MMTNRDNPIRRAIEWLDEGRALVKHQGWVRTLPIITRALMYIPYRKLNFLIVLINAAAPLPSRKPRLSLKIEPFAAKHLPHVSEIAGPREAKQCARRLALRDVGFTALHEDQVIGYGWISCRINAAVEQIPVPLEPGDALLSDAFTAPAYRGQGVQTALTCIRLNWLRQNGGTRALAYIDVHNAPSLAVWQRKFDAQVVGRVDFCRIGLWRNIKVMRTAPEIWHETSVLSAMGD